MSKRALSVTREETSRSGTRRSSATADMAEESAVRGCMVIKPWGYGIWERMQRRARRADQGHRPRQLLLPAVHPDELHRQGGRARRRLRQGDGGRHAPSPEERRRQADARSRGQARGAADRAADLRDDHRRRVPALDPVLSRPAAAHQPVGQRRALGDAHAAVPAHRRVPLAGGPYRARRPRRRDGRDAARCSRCTASSPRTCWRCR